MNAMWIGNSKDLIEKIHYDLEHNRNKYFSYTESTRIILNKY